MESQPKIKVFIKPKEPEPEPVLSSAPSSTPGLSTDDDSMASRDNGTVVKNAILREMKRSVPHPNSDSLTESERTVINLDHSSRDHVIKKFHEVFLRNKEIVDKWGNDYDILGLSEDLERELVLYSAIRCQNDGVTPDWSNRLFRQFYLHKALSIRDNLDPQSYIRNPNLLDRVLCGAVTHRDLMRSSPQELYPERWVEITAEKIRLAEAGSTVVNMGTTSLYRCGRCKKRECTYTQAQTRSSDEAMTTFITCTNCGNRWKE